MCSSSDSWGHEQCQASCAKCQSGLPPCTTPLPTSEPEPEPELSSTSTLSPSTAETSTQERATTSQASGACDASCQDIKASQECRTADSVWEMCSSSDSWWHEQCQASCAKCQSGLPPCTTPAPTGCDPLCTNTKAASECQEADTTWGMCTGAGSWWKKQCKAYCNECDGGLPACGSVETAAQEHVEHGPSLRGRMHSSSSSSWSSSSTVHRIVMNTTSHSNVSADAIDDIVTGGANYGSLHWIILCGIAYVNIATRVI